MWSSKHILAVSVALDVQSCVHICKPNTIFNIIKLLQKQVKHEQVKIAKSCYSFKEVVGFKKSNNLELVNILICLFK